MGLNFRDIVAGLAAGADTEGSLISGRKDSAKKLADAIALEKAKAGDKSTWKPLSYEIDLGDGNGPGAVEFNEQSGQYRRPQFPSVVPTTPAPAPARASPEAPPPAPVVSDPPIRRVPTPPPFTASLPGNPQKEVVSPPTTPVQAAMRQLITTPPSAPPTAPAPATPTTVPRIVQKPGRIDPNSTAGIAADSAKAANRALVRPDPLARRTPRNVMVDGVPKVVLVDGKGATYDQTGQPITGKITPYVPPVTAGAGGVGGFGAGGIGGAGRFVAGVGGLHNAHENMTQYEDAVATHQAKFDGLDYYKKLWGQMYDEKGIIDPAIHAKVMADLGATNPDLANYLQSAEMWALEDASLSARPSDFRTKLDGFVSALKPNQNAKGIEQMQHGRIIRLEGYDAALPALKAQLARVAGTTAAPESASSATKQAPPSGDFTDAEVLAAHNAGKRTDADIAAWITAQRKVKKP